ncbi:MAG: hypothetical protein P8K80_02445, partial [Phycisphaerales bacterium]|nr:hypothetical protein [Phycisphaerales bacterium]
MLIMALLSPCPASAAELVVGDLPGNYPTIQSAIDDARDGDEILIAEGTWQETIDLLGKAIVLGPLDGEVILDAAGAGSVVRCTSGEGIDTIIEGLVIRGGLAQRGAGLLTRNSTPTIRDCIFEANESLADGAAWAGDRGGPTFVGCLFLGNTAGEGETFSCGIDCTPLVLDCRFTGNCPQPKVDDWPVANASNLIEELPDTCTQALELVDGSTPFATVCAASERPGHAECELEGDAGTISSDIWYRYTPATTGLLRLSTCEYSDFDTDLAIYRGGCEQLELLGCNDDAPGCPGGPSELRLPVRMGDALLIRLGGGVEGAAGTGRLDAELLPSHGPSLPDLPPGMDPRSGRGATITVCSSGCNYTTIQGAIDASSNGDSIFITESGTYYENLDVTGKSIAIQGYGEVIIDGSNVGPVITAGGQTDWVLLWNLTLQNGQNDSSGTGSGGALAITIPEPTGGAIGRYFFYQCILRDNSANYGGAIGTAVPLTGASPKLYMEGCTLTGNSADRGGGIYGNFSLFMRDSVVEENQGGGLDLFFNATDPQGTLVHLHRSSISYNEGYGIKLDDFVYAYGAWAIVNNCLIAGNTNTGIHCYNGYLSILHSTIAHNSSPGPLGAGLYHNACGGFGHWIYNSIFWGNRNANGRTFRAQYDDAGECLPAEVVLNCIIEQNELVDNDAELDNLTDKDPLFRDPLGPDDLPGTNDGEFYDLLPGSSAIDAGWAEVTATEYWNWFNPWLDAMEYISALVDIDGANHQVDDPMFESDIGVPGGGYWPDLGCYELLDGSAGNPRLFVWRNQAYNNNFWTFPGNWYNYGDWESPDLGDSALFSSEWLQSSGEEPVEDTPNSIPLLQVQNMIFGPGTWTFDGAGDSFLLNYNNGSEILVGTIQGDAPARLEMTNGASFLTSRVIVDGDGEGVVELSGEGTECGALAILDNSNTGWWLLRGGRLVVADGADVAGVVRNYDGVFQQQGDITFGGNEDGNSGQYRQKGTLDGNPSAGTLVKNAGDTLSIINGGVTLGGTVVIDFDGTNPKAGDIIEILKYSSSAGETKNVVIQPLGLPPGSFLKVSLEEVQERDRSFYALMGEITTVGQVFGLNQAAESPITAVPTDAKLADVDADGFLDLAFTLPSSSGSGNLVVMLNQGDDLDGDGFWDGFEPVASITVLVGVDPSGVDVGDVDGTGTLDAVVSNEGSGNVTVIRDLGGSPSASTIELDDSLDEPEPTDLCLFDVEDDGTNEILVACENDGTLRILAHGLRSGSAEEEVINFTEAPPFEIDPSEEEDSKNAGVLIVSRASNKATSMRRGIGSRIGALEVASVLTTDATPVDIAIADFDGNEVEDYVVINEDGNSFDIFLREDDDGDGYPEVLGGATVGLLATGNPRSVATGDFDTDGDMDIAIVLDNEAGTRVTRIWRNDRIVEIDGVLVDLEYLTFADTGTELPSGGEPIIVVAGDVDDVGAGGDPSQVGDDAVILSSGSALRSGVGGTVTPNVGGPAKVDTVDGFVTAFKIAQDGDTILLAGGDYYLPNTLAFDGRDLRLIGRVDTYGNPLTVIHAPSAGSRTFTMTGGLTSSSLLQNIIIDGDGTAGGIYMQNTTDPGPQLVNCIFRDCYWTGSGAGLRADNAHPDLQYCQFDGCISEDDGGGAYLSSAASMDATATRFEDCQGLYGGGLYAHTDCRGDLVTCTFERNEATNPEAGDGGAIYAWNADLVADECTFVANSAVDDGGAILSRASMVSLTDSLFQMNNTPSSGGAIYAFDGSNMIATNCTFGADDGQPTDGQHSNTCPADGAAIYATGTDTELLLIGCVFRDNDAGRRGGAVIVRDGTSFDAYNSLFEDNTTSGYAGSWVGGGALYSYNVASFTLDQCQFFDNSSQRGGAVRHGLSAQPATVTNCEFRGNSATISSDPSLTSSGGALLLFESSPCTLHECTIINNESTHNGGGLRVETGTPVTLDNSIVCSNSPDQVIGSTTNINGTFIADSCDGDNDGIDDNEDSWLYGPNPGVPGSLQLAVDNAVDGDTITLDEGAYTASSGAAAVLDTGGKEITIVGQLGTDGVPTSIIDGEGVRDGLLVENGSSGTSIFQNLLIQHGAFGAYVSQSSALFDHCWFIDNTTTTSGAALYVMDCHEDDDHSVTIESCRFESNAALTGAGIWSSDATMVITDTVFNDNHSTASDGAAGGVYFRSVDVHSSLNMTGCVFTRNTAANYAGGLACLDSTIEIHGTRFGDAEDDSAGNTTPGNGGAVNAQRCSLMATDCQFHYGDSNIGGGVYVNDCHESLGHSVSIQSCRFTNNDAATGGGFVGHDSTITINDTDFDANSSTASNGAGGAMYLRSWPDQELPSELTMTGCTFTGNHAENTGGGIWSYQVDLNLDSCTFGDPTDATAGNTSLGYGGAIRFSNLPNASYSTTQNFTASIHGGGFYDNHANGRGGALYYAGMPLTIEPSDDGSPCVFRGNTTGAGTSDIAEIDRGGAISIDDGSFAAEHDDGDGPILSVTGAIFENNSTEDQWGGALYLHDVETEFTDCTFTGNNATIGGAIRCFRRTTTLTNCDFTGNHARVNLDGTWGFGGAISSDESSIHATNCTFSANDAQAGSGGGVYLTEADHSFTDCEFQSNTAHVSGGAFYLDQSTAQFLDCVIGSLDDPVDGNIANSEFGGGLFLIRSLVEMTNCVIANNVATNSTGCAYGGGFFAQDCLAADGRGLTLLDCMVEENQACLGGGAFLDGVVMTATNTTFVQNAAIGSDGSAINGSLLGTDGAPTEITLIGCTVTGNQATGTHALYNASGNLLAIESSTICDNTDTTDTPQDPIHGAWTDLGDNCISINCDSDADGTYDCIDGCPNDPDKIAPGVCGCGTPDTDTDSDGTPDCIDGCPNDPDKIAPGVCGCGTPDVDSDSDGVLDCEDGCPNDPDKIAPGVCGCGTPDVDSDSDGVLDCEDGCPNDPDKIAPGV